jgi:uncharacterized protein YndB with AHSA1/START domain
VSVTNVEKDATKLTLVVVADFDAPPAKVWNLFEDPRKLERWWGPPVYPATFLEHNLSPDGRMSYFMTGPEGDQSHGWWHILELDPPHRLVFENGIADDEGNPDPAMPFMLMVVELDERSGEGTQLTVTANFPSLDAMNQFITMGMEEGVTGAMSQMDALL